MLVEIRSDRLRQKSVRFHPGVNVVLGDENATNSIGKSSLLLLVDFAFGGTIPAKALNDLTAELGDHDYFFCFKFADEIYWFSRGTADLEEVWQCNEECERVKAIRIDEYTAWLKRAYAISADDITFRTLAGLYARIWGKDNLNVHRPLHIYQAQSARECVNNLIKTFAAYGPIKKLSEALRKKEEERDVLSTALRRNVIPRIGKREHSENVSRIGEVEKEIEDIKANLAKYATNISEVVNRDVLELKVEKDGLLAAKLKVQTQLARVERNLRGNRHIKSKHFEGLVRFFPAINQDRLAAVEEFHSGVARLLGEELRQSERELKDELAQIDQELSTIDKKMASTLSSIKQPGRVVDRVFQLATSLKEMRGANQHFEKEMALRAEVEELSSHLSTAKVRVLDGLQERINDGLRRVVTSVFGSERKSPKLTLGETNYSFEVFEDTGTGTAYWSLIVLDLTIFQETQLPWVVHDSVLFKNIENDSVANLFKVYSEIDKQSFVAIDEIAKYGEPTAALLRRQRVIELDTVNVLFTKDWRPHRQEGA